MSLPLFFASNLQQDDFILDEDSSKHIIGVLRKEAGEQVQLTDGKGTRITASITDPHRKRCAVRVIARVMEPQAKPQVSIAISLVKNPSRFEWFLEKATELGVGEIIPLLCARTEKEKFRADRLDGILNSAMLQSQQVWKPRLHEPLAFQKVLSCSAEEKFIAHCEEGNKKELGAYLQNTTGSRIILIGPEGDFTPQEIDEAIAAGFIAVSLGNTRLRTETAGMAAAVLMTRT